MPWATIRFRYIRSIRPLYFSLICEHNNKAYKIELSRKALGSLFRLFGLYIIYTINIQNICIHIQYIYICIYIYNIYIYWSSFITSIIVASIVHRIRSPLRRTSVHNHRYYLNFLFFRRENFIFPCYLNLNSFKKHKIWI